MAVAHGPGSYEERRLFSQHVGSQRLELVDGRVIPEYVVAHLSLGHGEPHLRGRVRDGV